MNGRPAYWVSAFGPGRVRVDEPSPRRFRMLRRAHQHGRRIAGGDWVLVWVLSQEERARMLPETILTPPPGHSIDNAFAYQARSGDHGGYIITEWAQTD